jgi:hypothetical protein
LPAKNIQVKKGGKGKKQVGVICEPDLLDNDRHEPDIQKLPKTIKKNKNEVMVVEEEKWEDPADFGMMDFS